MPGSKSSPASQIAREASQIFGGKNCGYDRRSSGNDGKNRSSTGKNCGRSRSSGRGGEASVRLNRAEREECRRAAEREPSKAK